MLKLDFGGGDDIQFLREGRAGIIKLTRPKALNALSHSMILAMRKALTAWETDDDVCCVLVEAEGRAFCAGADIVSIYNRVGNESPNYAYFEDEYSLNAYIGRYPKPYVSFIDGVVMGGGAGISVHGSHRIVTQNTIFAMPEASIGFFTDVGGGRFLGRLPSFFGFYLALSSDRIKWGDCLQTGIATHAIKSDDYPVLRQAVVNDGDPRPALDALSLEPNYETSPEIRALIAECFSQSTVEECLNALKNKISDENEFAQHAFKKITNNSPISLKVILHQLQLCKPLGLDDCMIVENRIAHRMLDGHDFYEGIRAALIDKDHQPTWQYTDLADVSEELVDAYFQPLETDLKL